MQWVNADISQRFLISLILFLFFNASLIEKCKALEIKIEVLDFVNDINILIYDKITESICKLLSRAYNVCAKWAWTHDATFASEKYKLTFFIRKSKRFNMTVSLHIENSIIKLKSNVWVLEVHRLITSSRVLKFKLSTQLKKCWVELRSWTRELELSWKAWLKNSTQKLDLTRQDIR